MFPEIRTAIIWMLVLSSLSLAACSSDSRQGEDWQFTFDATTDHGDAPSDSTETTGGDTRYRSDVRREDADVVPDVDSPSDSACWFPTPTSELEESCQSKGKRDSDDDGLTDEREHELCDGAGTDPDEEDTDQDGLPDCWEVEIGTDPCNQNTDGDGLPDPREVALCLDPTDPNSPTPEQEWIETACEFSPPEMDLETGPNRRWQYARSRAVDRFEAVGYEGSDDRISMVTFRASPLNAEGAVMSFVAETEPSNLEPLDLVDRRVEPAVRNLGDIEETETQESSPIAFLAGSRVTYRLTLEDGPASPAKLRNDLAHALQPADDTDFTDMPMDADTTYDDYRITVGLHQDDPRSNCRDGSQRFVVAALAVRPVDTSSRESADRGIERLVAPRILWPGDSSQTTECLRFSYPQMPGTDGSRLDEEGDLHIETHRAPVLRETIRVRVDERRVPRGEEGFEFDFERGVLEIDESALTDRADREPRHLISLHFAEHVRRCDTRCTVQWCTKDG